MLRLAAGVLLAFKIAGIGSFSIWWVLLLPIPGVIWDVIKKYWRIG